MESSLKSVEGIVVEGHQVASGTNKNPLFPGGTLAMQLPYFKALGLDLVGWHPATVNTSIAPRDFKILKPNWRFENVAWHPTEPPEDFSFVTIKVSHPSEQREFDGLIYYPHPETKPAHHQPRGMIEILLKEYVSEIGYGSTLLLHLPADRVEIIE